MNVLLNLNEGKFPIKISESYDLQLTSEINQFLDEAQSKGIIHKMVNSIDQFDKTQENLDELIRLSKRVNGMTYYYT